MVKSKLINLNLKKEFKLKKSNVISVKSMKK